MINKLFSVLNIADSWLAVLLPLVVRLPIWGILGGVLSITIYAKISSQTSIGNLKKKTRTLQREMLNVDLKLPDFMRLSRENINTSLRLFFIVLGPALVSALPVILLAIWIHTCLAFEAPSTTEGLQATTDRGDIELRLLSNTDLDEISRNEINPDNLDNSKEIIVMAENKVIYSGNPLSPPTPVIHKRRWWNVLFDSPAGYIVEDASIGSIRLNIFKKQVVKWMPDWAAGWEVPFFVFVLLAALGIKLGFKIE